MDAPQLITAIKDSVLALSAAVTAGVAVFGVNKWRQELNGKARFEAARALAKAAYNLRDQIHGARSPLITPDEFPSGYSQKQRPSNGEKRDAYAHLYSNRWKPVRAAVAEFEVQALEAEALWGASVRQLSHELDV
ncbi:MAG: hypothetical protein ABFC67_00010 [Mizugakiibacter sp.]|uniref:hypothetical protein n=1 Tax=Mizugakiibacter sp. TaxID=1972610 RepID=UPI0031C57C8B|nr:hypothetical protein [Xanthomonadaceae bacterium]